MSDERKALVNLATGLEDAERVTIAFLIAGQAANEGRDTLMFLTKEAVRLATSGFTHGVACDGCPTLETLFTQYANAGGRLLVCPICFTARKLAPETLAANATIGGATALWQWIGDNATVFSY